jgi:hypothetical protein
VASEKLDDDSENYCSCLFLTYLGLSIEIPLSSPSKGPLPATDQPSVFYDRPEPTKGLYHSEKRNTIVISFPSKRENPNI